MFHYKGEYQILQSLQYASFDPCMLMEEGITWPLMDTMYRSWFKISSLSEFQYMIGTIQYRYRIIPYRYGFGIF